MNCKYFQSYPKGFVKITGQVVKFECKGLNLIAHRNCFTNKSGWKSDAFVVTHADTGFRVCSNDSDVRITRKGVIEEAKRLFDTKNEEEIKAALEMMETDLIHLIDRLFESGQILTVPFCLLKELRPGYVSDYQKAITI